MSSTGNPYPAGNGASQAVGHEDLLPDEVLAVLQAVGELVEDDRANKKASDEPAVSPSGRGRLTERANMRRSTTPDHSPPRQRKRARKDSDGSSIPLGGENTLAPRARSSLPRIPNDPGSAFIQLNDTNKYIYLQQHLDQLLLSHQNCHLKLSQAQRREHDLEAKLRASNLYCQQITESAQAELKGLLDQLSDCKKEHETLRASTLEERRKEDEWSRRYSDLQALHTLVVAERDTAQGITREVQKRLRIAGATVQAKEEELRTLRTQVANGEREIEKVRSTGVSLRRGKFDAERRVKELEAIERTLRNNKLKMAESMARAKTKRREAEDTLASAKTANEAERLACIAERDQARREAAQAKEEAEALREDKTEVERTMELLREGRDIQDVMWVKHCREMRGVRVKEEPIKVKEEPAD